MTTEELRLILSRLEPNTENTLVKELNIKGIGLIEIEIELGQEREINSDLLKSILEYVISNLEPIKIKSNIVLNSLAKVRSLKSNEVKLNIDFQLVGIYIVNDEIFYDQFKIVFGYNQDLVHQNEDILGYRTVNFSGSINNFYLSGTNWIY